MYIFRKKINLKIPFINNNKIEKVNDSIITIIITFHRIIMMKIN